MDVLIPVVLFAVVVAWRIWADWYARQPVKDPDDRREPRSGVRRLTRPELYDQDASR